MTTASVRLESFTGPLDLLLHLVRENEVDIHDISIAQIAEQYLKLLENMQKLDIEIAGEFLVMAATLAEIKARQLLPRSLPVDEEDFLLEDEGDDPRLDLIRQLLRFRFFKERAGMIERLIVQRSRRKNRPEDAGLRLKAALPGEPEEETLNASTYVLAAIMKRLREETARYGHRPIVYDDIPVEEKVEEILAALADKGRILFQDLIEDPGNPMEVVTAFLAVLELVRQRLAAIRQIEEMDAIVILRPEDAPPVKAKAIKPLPAVGRIEIAREAADDPLLAELSKGLIAAHEAAKKIEELKRGFSHDEEAPPEGEAGKAQPSTEGAPAEQDAPQEAQPPDAAPAAPDAPPEEDRASESTSE